MKYTLSHCLCIETPHSTEAARFYQDVFGMEFSTQDGDSIELRSGERLLSIDRSQTHKTIFEFYVDDLEAARKDLEEKGCQVVRWEGIGKPCYMSDPFGNIFNLYQH